MRAVPIRAALLAIIAALAASTAAAAAEPVPPRARKLADRGRELHQRGDYVRAIAAFKEAYVLAPTPGLLFNLAQAYRLQGNCDDAALMYRRYLADAPSRSERTLAETHLATVERCIQKRNLNLPPDPAMASLPMPPPPGPDPLFVDEPPPRLAPPARGRRLRNAGIGATAGGAAALATAAYFGLRAREASSDVERRYAQGASWRDILSVRQRGERAETAAQWLAIGGGVTAAAGVTLIILGRRSERAAPLTIAPTQGGARVGMSWSF